MKNIYLLLSAFLILTLASLTNGAYAQVSAGPSDATTAPPANATDVGKVYCAGSTISIVGPQDVGNVDFAVYHWYKLDALGNKQTSTIKSKTYTEISTAPGYYEYELVTENTNGCTSPTSDILKVFVLPPISATITTPVSTICSVVGTTVLTANPTPATGYVINYQWTRNGTNIAGATTNTYTVAAENTPATVAFGVNVTYALNSSCAATATYNVIVSPVPTKPAITAN
jgi:hypothetical protein